MHNKRGMWSNITTHFTNSFP